MWFCHEKDILWEIHFQDEKQGLGANTKNREYDTVCISILGGSSPAPLSKQNPNLRTSSRSPSTFIAGISIIFTTTLPASLIALAAIILVITFVVITLARVIARHELDPLQSFPAQPQSPHGLVLLLARAPMIWVLNISATSAFGPPEVGPAQLCRGDLCLAHRAVGLAQRSCVPVQDAASVEGMAAGGAHGEDDSRGVVGCLARGGVAVELHLIQTDAAASVFVLVLVGVVETIEENQELPVWSGDKWRSAKWMENNRPCECRKRIAPVCRCGVRRDRDLGNVLLEKKNRMKTNNRSTNANGTKGKAEQRNESVERTVTDALTRNVN